MSAIIFIFYFWSGISDLVFPLIFQSMETMIKKKHEKINSDMCFLLLGEKELLAIKLRKMQFLFCYKLDLLPTPLRASPAQHTS